MAIFKSIGHIALWVTDLQRTIDFYEKLGFAEFLRLDEVPGVPWIAYVRITEDLYLELFPEGYGGKPDPTAKVGLSHLCLTTDDIEQAAAYLDEAGIEPTTRLDLRRIGVDGNRGMWIVDPDGNRIEIMEMAPDCIQYEAIRTTDAGAPPRTLLQPRHKS